MIDELLIHLDDVHLEPHLVKAPTGLKLLALTEAAHPPRLCQRCSGFNVKQPRRHDHIGVIPEPPARLTGWLVDHQRYECGSAQIADHRRCSVIRSLTVPMVASGAGAGCLRVRARWIRPSSRSCSSFVGRCTGTMRAIGRPWSVTVTIRPSRT